MAQRRINVHIPGQRPYAVRLGRRLLGEVGAMLAAEELANPRATLLLVTDTNVAPLYLATVRASLERSGFRVADAVIEAGEASKTIDVATELWETMAELGLGRDSAVVALGGGVVGDLAGFVASTYMRGLPVIQIPTTLLAVVDSSVGGKTAVDLPQGKNLVGTFLQPRIVIADIETFATLTPREWRCGMAELIKSAIIDGDEFFFTLCDAADSLGSFEAIERTAADDAAGIAAYAASAIVFKAGVVARDVEERAGIRQCLNYGHTLGHAVETLAGFGTLSHGACVAEGMRFAAWLSERRLGCSGELVRAQNDLLDAVGLEKLELPWSVDELFGAMKRDKKARGATLQFVLIRDVGDWSLQSIDDADVRAALSAWLA